jgi:guanyl-specific ribonuclease Sa
MVPDHVLIVLRSIRAAEGLAPPGYRGGQRFHNREGHLPAGLYREYDVHPWEPGVDRGAERLVIEATTGVAFYTSDHYVTFEAIEE